MSSPYPSPNSGGKPGFWGLFLNAYHFPTEIWERKPPGEFSLGMFLSYGSCRSAPSAFPACLHQARTCCVLERLLPVSQGGERQILALLLQALQLPIVLQHRVMPSTSTCAKTQGLVPSIRAEPPGDTQGEGSKPLCFIQCVLHSMSLS